MAPLTPVSAPPSMNTLRNRRSMSMPVAATISRLSTPARMIRPSWERNSSR